MSDVSKDGDSIKEEATVSFESSPLPDAPKAPDGTPPPDKPDTPKVIASTYEILEEIGEGGGGKVYRGRHRNLNKTIVLKADKRTQANASGAQTARTVSKEVLRREVDALKNLHHMYLPQVYDYVEQDGVVYTVMDYIEGYSLDKPLKEGKQFKQSDIVEWACELLEALCYLHSRPPYGILHSDIKPANIMLTPQGDIRLIDFNIALALGEEGAVRVGRSQGYASPEHYGEDFSSLTEKKTERAHTRRGQNPEKRQTWASSLRDSSLGTSSNHTVMLDVRSDIYSLGATLYHLLTGQRPARRAQDVIPIGSFPDKNISPLIARIIEKAMNPNPNLRYQTAKEMLWAFEHLYENDPRSRRRRRRILLVSLFSAFALALGGLLTFVGLQQQNRWNSNLVAAGNSREALQSGNVDLAVSEALKALPEERGWLDPPYTAEAQRALANALGVYDLTDGYKAHKLITLKSPVSGEAVKAKKTTLSPYGSLAAALVNELDNWWIYIYETASGEVVTPEPLKAMPFAAIDFLFTESGMFLYAGENGLTCYNPQTRTEEWRTNRPATQIALSGDGAVAATIYRDESSAALWNALTGEPLGEDVDFHGRSLRLLSGEWKSDPEFNLFALNSTGEWMAVSFADSSASLYRLPDREEISIYDAGETDCKYFEGGFYRSFFTITCYGGTTSHFMVVRLDDIQPIHFADDPREFHVRTDADGIYLYRPSLNVISQINPEAYTDDAFIVRNLAAADTKITSFRKKVDRTLVTCSDGSWLLFDADGNLITRLSGLTEIHGADVGGEYLLMMSQNSPYLRIQRWERHPLGENDFSYQPDIFHLEAKIHSDQQTALLFWTQRFSIVDREGRTLFEADIPNPSGLWDAQYRRAGDTDVLGNRAEQDFLELWYRDGLVKTYSAKDGTELSSQQGPTPESLGIASRHEEVMETEHYRVVSPLNASPELYNKSTGERIAALEADGDLMYVYETREGLIAHYLRDDQSHSRFATLLDEHGQVIADMPCLTDVLPDGALVFDDTFGNLRQSRIYSIQDLIQTSRVN